MEEAHRLDRQDAIWLAIIALLAALLRLPALDRVPPGYQFDEAYNALDALEVLAGNHRLFLPANGGREAVSYTHLDVYKRQVWYCRIRRRCSCSKLGG